MRPELDKLLSPRRNSQENDPRPTRVVSMQTGSISTVPIGALADCPAPRCWRRSAGDETSADEGREQATIKHDAGTARPRE